MAPQEPIEPDEVEYYEAPSPVRRPVAGPQVVVMEGGGLPCCSGCGCLLIVLAVVLVANPGGIFTTLLLLAAAAWASAFLLRAAGISRLSPVYVYLLVPLFLAVANLASRYVKGQWALSAGEIVLGTLLIYAFLWLARGLIRARM